MVHPMDGTVYVWMTTTFALLIYVIMLRSRKKRKIKIRGENYQVVVILNKDLKMSKGKALSQFGHAIDAMHDMLAEFPSILEAWRHSGSAKIVLKGTQDEMNKAYYDAKELGLLYQRVFDAGRTQVQPGSNTCVLVGPASRDELNPVTGHLPLY